MYRRTKTVTRLLIFLPAAVLGLLAPDSAFAEFESGIGVTVYNNFGYNSSPPLPEISGRPAVGFTTFENINQNFDQSPVFSMYEDFIVKYEGFITSPVSGSISFWPHADDGTKFYLDGVLIDDGNWVDKGGGGYQTEPQYFVGGESKPFTYWYYENGGGANTSLYWDIGNGWEIVPASAFTKTAVPTTTTTLQKFLDKPLNVVLTDTGSGILVEWEAPENNVDVSPERYAISWSTGNSGWGVATGNVGDANSLNTFILLDYSLFSSTGGLESEYLITVRADNDTFSVYSERSDAQTLLIGVNPPSPTTTTTIPPTTTTMPPTTTTVPPATTTTSTTSTSTTTTTIVKEEVPLWTTTTVLTPIATVPVTTTSTTTTTEQPVGTTTSTIPVQTTVLQQTEQPQTTTTTLPPKIEEDISSDEATEIATNPEVISTLNSEQAAQVFSAINIDEVTEEEAAQIIEAVQEAPQEVREAFEQEINVFGGKVDTYVPLGSTIPVGQRRVIVAIAAITAAVPVAPTRRS